MSHRVDPYAGSWGQGADADGRVPARNIDMTPISASIAPPSIASGPRTLIIRGVLQGGTRQIVFVDHGEGSLEPRVVQLGARVGDDCIVLKGLKAGERIVTSANFLIDSESQLQAALGAFIPPPPGAGTGTAVPSASQASKHRYHHRAESTAQGHQRHPRKTHLGSAAPGP
ncbi:MAG: hypothetical protein ACREU2_11350 [Steroidobacteraceae bacterium]